MSDILRKIPAGHLLWCPGCETTHVLPANGWMFNGNCERPSFSPSFKHSGMQRLFEHGRWTGEWKRDAAGAPIPFVCHYILTAGVLNYCGDSTHALAGRAVPLQPVPADLVGED